MYQYNTLEASMKKGADPIHGKQCCIDYINFNTS